MHPTFVTDGGGRVRDVASFGLVLLATLFACGPDEEATPPDPIDAVVVDNAALASDQRLEWVLGAEPTVSIGTTSGDEVRQLFRVRDATALAGGELAIANSGTGEIRVFDRAGAHLVSMGGAGEGPGEFISLARVDRWRGDSILAWDSRQLRVSIFSASGAHGRTFRVRDFEDTFGPEYIGALPDGRLLMRAGFPRRDDTPFRGMYRTERAYALVDAEGHPSASLGTHPGDEGFLWARGGLESFSEHPLAKATPAAVWGSLALISPNDRYELRAFDDQGRLARVVRLEHMRRAPTQGDMDAWFEEFTADDTPEERADARREFVDYPVLESFPAFESILVDALDHVWVRDFPIPGEETTGWVVFDPRGRALGRFDTPPGLEVLEIGADELIGRRRDDLDVEFVERWRLTRR